MSVQIIRCHADDYRFFDIDVNEHNLVGIKIKCPSHKKIVSIRITPGKDIIISEANHK